MIMTDYTFWQLTSFAIDLWIVNFIWGLVLAIVGGIIIALFRD